MRFLLKKNTGHINVNPINSDTKENNTHIPIYKACQECKDREACCKGKHGTITRYGHELLNQAEELMEIKENKKEYKQRNKVEAPNGTYKTYYHINELA